MTDPRLICPIPPDAKVGDFVVINKRGCTKIMDMQSRFVDDRPIETGIVFLNQDGNGIGDAYCIAFEYADGRKPNLPSTGKPKRTQAQRDAAYLRRMAKGLESKGKLTRAHHLRKIADRLEKQQ